MAAGFDHIAGEANIADPIRGLGQLPQDTARGLEGLMDVPKRAGATEAGELQPGRGVALGDGAGLVDPGEEERDALGAGALQGRQAVRNLLDRGAETTRKRV